MLIRISALCARNSGEEIDVTFEISNGEHTDRQTLTVSSKQYLVLGLCKGESDETVYDEVVRAAEVWSATKKGISSLGYGACSEKALIGKLVAKGFDKETAAEATQELVAMGLLCAADDAFREAQKQAAKLWGKKRIVSELYRKGYDSQAISSALDRLEDDGIDFVKSCEKMISKSYRRMLSEADSQKKLVAALMRYGYSVSEIKQAITNLI